MIPVIAFYVFAVILLASATMVVSARNTVLSALFLILAFFNGAALFLIAGAEFLALILVIVYIGAVAVLFLFVVMMLDVNYSKLREGVQHYAPIGVVVGAILLAELGLVFSGWHFAPNASEIRMSPTPIGLHNTAALGNIIYTHYILLFQLAGLILLVAMIGAIVLTHQVRGTARSQRIGRQVGRQPEQTLAMLKVALGAGTDEVGILRPLADPVAGAEPAGPEPAGPESHPSPHGPGSF